MSLAAVQFLNSPTQVSVRWRTPQNHTADTFHLCARPKKAETFPFCRQFPSRFPLKIFKIHGLKNPLSEAISAVSGSSHCSPAAKVQLTEPSFLGSSSRSGAASAGSLSSCSTGAPFLVRFSVPPWKFQAAISDREGTVLPAQTYLCSSWVLARPLASL